MLNMFLRKLGPLNSHQKHNFQIKFVAKTKS